MTALPKVQFWIEHGQLLTNRPDVFAKQFEMPTTAPVDGLSRVSHKPRDIFAKSVDEITDDVELWLSKEPSNALKHRSQKRNKHDKKAKRKRRKAK